MSTNNDDSVKPFFGTIRNLPFLLAGLPTMTSCSTNNTKPQSAGNMAANIKSVDTDSSNKMSLRENDKKISRELAFDIVHYISKVRTDKVKPYKLRFSKTMRRTADEVSKKHEILFKAMVKKLHINEANAQATIDNIANEMLSDGQFNWGRLVTLYAFSGLLAKHCAENDNECLVEKIAVYTGNYIAEHLIEYVHQYGGWDAFDEFFPDPNAADSPVWRGLLYTVVGLGAIATMVSAR